MKIIVVGCTHAGTAAVVTAAKDYEDAEIIVYERNNNISFLSCGIALYVQGVVKDPEGLFYSSPEALNDLGVTTKMEHDVMDIDYEAQTVKVKNLTTGEIMTDSYDKLILTTGSWPIDPALPGRELKNILLSKNFNHSNVIIEQAKEAKKVVVVGAGYIGVELVEAFQENGKEVVLIDALDRILSKYLDKDLTDDAEAAFTDLGVKLALGECVTGFEGDESGAVTKVLTDKGSYEADMVILCIGFKPNTHLVKGELDTLENGAIVVNKYMQTSQPNVYAAGDSCAVYHNPSDAYSYIPLATNAIRMGYLVGKNLVTPKLPYLGTQGTSGIKIYGYNISSTGLTQEAALLLGKKAKSVTAEDNNRPEFMPTYDEVKLKLIYDEESHQVLGAQIISHADMTQMMNTMSVCIQNKMTIEDLAVVDFFFQPHYNKPWSIINLAGQAAVEVEDKK